MKEDKTLPDNILNNSETKPTWYEAISLLNNTLTLYFYQIIPTLDHALNQGLQRNSISALGCVLLLTQTLAKLILKTFYIL